MNIVLAAVGFKNGDIVDVFRRVSEGWKESCADAHYKEGDSFHTFEYLNTKISIGLCGDLLDEEYASHMKMLDADMVIWPVYTDFNFDEWNSAVKYEYAEQEATKHIAKKYSFNTQSQRMFQSVGFVQTDDEWYEYCI